MGLTKQSIKYIVQSRREFRANMTTGRRQDSWYLLALLACLSFLPISCLANENDQLFAKISRYAAIANSAYLAKPEAQKIIEAQGYRLTRFSRIPEVEVTYLVATNDAEKHQIIAVRGTANVENAIVDVSLKLLMDKHAHILLHQGFAQAAESIYKEVLPTLNKDYTISTTGHSLGGAVALILAMYLNKDQHITGPVITFGQPKVTNISGALAFKQLDVIRVVTARDLVPLVPPLDPMDINNLNIYWHLGKEIVLLPNKDYAELEGLKSMMRATRIINTTLSQDNLEYHKMIHYLKQIKRKVKDARRVPYDTSIDLLKLFGQ